MVDLLAHPMGINLDKVFHQRGNVFATRPQRWQRDRKHIQTVVEVVPKFVPLHHVLQVSVGRSHEPNVDLVSPCAAQAFELLLLQNTQQFGLQCQWNISDLIQEEGPFVGQFEATDFLRDGACESALLMAEKLAFQQIVGNSSAIQLHEWASAARTEVVYGVCYQILAGASFSLDKGGGTCWSDNLDEL